MNMDRNSLLTIVACIVFFVAYQSYLSSKYPNMGKPSPVASDKDAAAPSPNLESNQASKQPKTSSQASLTETVTQEAETIQQLESSDLVIETGNAIYEFDQDFSALSRVLLKNYQSELGSSGGPLVNVLDSPMKVQAITDLSSVEGVRGFSARRDGKTIAFSRQDGIWLVEQKFTIPEQGYAIEVDVTYKNTSNRREQLDAGLLVQENLVFSDDSSFGPADLSLAHTDRTASTGVPERAASMP